MEAACAHVRRMTLPSRSAWTSGRLPGRRAGRLPPDGAGCSGRGDGDTSARCRRRGGGARWHALVPPYVPSGVSYTP
eukprot:4044380-Prymnesium_polylepis.1